MDNKETKLTRKIYAANVRGEWNRLVQDPFHRLEFDTTLKFLKNYLPKKGLILDAGGGPGRYTIELAKLGLDVILLDLVPEHLKFAKKKIKKAGIGKRIKEVIEGSITNLSKFKNNSFDAVLCLGGPLSHIYSESERQKAISELVRVVKKGAPIFVSVMSKYGVLLATPRGWPYAVADKKYFQKFILSGDDYKFRRTGYCHFFTLEELEKIFLREKVIIIQKVGLEGFNVDKKTTNRFAKKFPLAWKNWLEIHNKMCTEPFVTNASGHILIIAKKK